MPQSKPDPQPAIADGEVARLTLAEFISEAGGATEAIHPLTTGQIAALDVLGFAPDQLKTYAARTQENFEFVNAMCQMRG